jgi:hypothetical protein
LDALALDLSIDDLGVVTFGLFGAAAGIERSDVRDIEETSSWDGLRGADAVPRLNDLLRLGLEVFDNVSICS